MMHGLSLIYEIREIPGVDAFRITQKRLTYFELELVTNQHYDKHGEARIREGFSRRLRAPVAVQIRYSDRIPATASGKTRHVVSQVNPPADAWAFSPDWEQLSAQAMKNGTLLG